MRASFAVTSNRFGAFILLIITSSLQEKDCRIVTVCWSGT